MLGYEPGDCGGYKPRKKLSKRDIQIETLVKLLEGDESFDIWTNIVRAFPEISDEVQNIYDNKVDERKGLDVT